MAIKITSTRDYAAIGAKALVHSPAGFGKTVLCSTAPRPIIISAESGLLSLAEQDIPVIEVKTVNDVNDVYDWARLSNESKNYDTLCLDSVSEIAEVLLAEFKSQFTDARQAYGMLNDEMAKTIRAFRDLKGKNVYFTAKQAMILDDMNVSTFKASMPGKTLLRDLPFFFDIVMALRIGTLEDGTTYRYLQTQPDLKYDCKDRSGKLDPIERPDLMHLFTKINGVADGAPLTLQKQTVEIPDEREPDDSQEEMSKNLGEITSSRDGDAEVEQEETESKHEEDKAMTSNSDANETSGEEYEKPDNTESEVEPEAEPEAEINDEPVE